MGGEGRRKGGREDGRYEGGLKMPQHGPPTLTCKPKWATINNQIPSVQASFQLVAAFGIFVDCAPTSTGPLTMLWA